MKYQGKKVIGVWIDHQQAIMISTADRMSTGDYSVLKKIASAHHGDHSSSEDSHHKKVAQDIIRLYDDVSQFMKEDDAIFITGPGTAQEELKNHLQNDQHFKSKEIELGTSDHPTENQMIAEVRNHFNESK